MIYLDSAATSQIDKRVLDAMMPYLENQYGNPGSIHILGRASKVAIDKARGQVAMQAIFLPYGITHSDDAQGVRNGGMGSTDRKKG